MAPLTKILASDNHILTSQTHILASESQTLASETQILALETQILGCSPLNSTNKPLKQGLGAVESIVSQQ